MKQVRWGMIGCGAVTETKSAPAYVQVEGSRLVAVASRTPRSAHAYAQRHGVEHVFERPEDLIRSPNVDAVYIATPPASHFDLAMQVAQAGKPCSVEKPLAMTSIESEALVAAFEGIAQPLFVAYYRRSLPRFVHVKGLLADGMIGVVRHVHWSLARVPTAADLAGASGWRTDREQAPGGYFEDLACHGLDLFDHLIGSIVEAGGVSYNQQHLYDVPDAVSASWRHGNGATGSGFWNFAAFARSDQVEIIGSKGIIRFSVFDEAPIALQNGSGSKITEIPNPDPIQFYHVRNMIGHIGGQAIHPSIGRSAARTDWVMDQILPRRKGDPSTTARAIWRVT